MNNLSKQKRKRIYKKALLETLKKRFKKAQEELQNPTLPDTPNSDIFIMRELIYICDSEEENEVPNLELE